MIFSPPISFGGVILFKEINMIFEDANKIYTYAIQECLPDKAVQKALKSLEMPKGRLILVAIGKAAWQMANAAYKEIGSNIDCGIIITKYGHSNGQISNFDIYEAGHPVPDQNGIDATNEVLKAVSNLTAQDTVLFLVSGGGSALFESVDCTLDDLRDITSQLLLCGASINEINCIRKHLSNVKGGKFAQKCFPANIFAIVLSDVLGDNLDTIASGPACADESTVDDVKHIIGKYNLKINNSLKNILFNETPKSIDNAVHIIGGSVSELCRAAAYMSTKLGYSTVILSDTICCEACQAGSFLASIAKTHASCGKNIAFICGGETVVHVKGNGKGGRNQEVALAAAREICGIDNVAVFAIGSDGTDGPTDAAGGYADGKTWQGIVEKGINAEALLKNNDSYNALKSVNGLIFTGPTGTNVNDLYVVLISADKG